MKKREKNLAKVLMALMLGVSFIWAIPGATQESGNRYQLPEGIYINLTEDFYRALEKEDAGEKTYSTDRSNEYLRQIAISAKFMVDTNLQILKQQERIIRLLESINAKTK